MIDGKETPRRYRESYDPFIKEGEEVKFYGKGDDRVNTIGAPYEPLAERP